MATYYVSNTAANGIPVGTAGGDGSIGDPVLTFFQGEQLTSTGDTLLFNDGAYNTLTGLTDPTAGDINNGITIDSVTPYGASFFVDVAGTNQIMRFRNSAEKTTLGKIKIDSSNGLPARGLIDGNGPLDVTLDGTWLYGDPQTEGVLFNDVENLVMKGGWIIEKSESSTTHQFRFQGKAGGGTIDISDGTIKDQFASSADNGLNFDILQAGYTFLAHDIDVQTNDSAMASGTSHAAIYVSGAATVEIYNITVSNSTFTGHTDLVWVNNSALACTSCYVHDINVSMGSSAFDDGEHTTVIVGANTSGANNNSISNAIVERIVTTGNNHGILIGWVTGAEVRKCSLDLCTLGVVTKGTTSAHVSGCKVIRCESVYLYDKFGTDSIYEFNTVQMSAGYGSAAMLAAPDGANPSADPTFTNNIVESDVTVGQMCDIRSNTGTIKYNTFYSSVALPSNVYTWNGTGYDTLSAWETAAGATVATNNETDPDLQADLSILTTNALYGSGVKTWTGVNPEGYNDPIPNFGIDPGAMVNRNHPFHPLNL